MLNPSSHAASRFSRSSCSWMSVRYIAPASQLQRTPAKHGPATPPAAELATSPRRALIEFVFSKIGIVVAHTPCAASQLESCLAASTWRGTARRQARSMRWRSRWRQTQGRRSTRTSRNRAFRARLSGRRARSDLFDERARRPTWPGPSLRNFGTHSPLIWTSRFAERSVCIGSGRGLVSWYYAVMNFGTKDMDKEQEHRGVSRSVKYTSEPTAYACVTKRRLLSMVILPK